MRIKGPEMMPENRVSIRPVQLPSAGKVSLLSRADGSLSTQLARIFVDKGFDIPPTQLQALQAELTSLGMNTTDIDNNNAVKALLLQRFSIPLTREILTTAGEASKSSIVKDLSSLQENALKLLSDKYLTGETRKAVVSLVKNIDAVLKGEISPELIRFAADDILDLWMYDFESKLLSLTEGRGGSVSEIIGGRMSEIELALESLVKPHSINSADGRPMELLEVVRNAAAELRLKMRAMHFNSPETARMIKEAVDGFGERLSFIIGEYEGLFPLAAEGEQFNVLITRFMSSAFNMLENRLLTHMLIHAAAADFADAPNGEWNSLALRTMILKSGISFEWQLLAWYRSGRDPARLYAILQNDLKGTLIDFINRMRKHQLKKSGIRKKLERLEKESQNLEKHITNSQLSNILDDYDDKRGIYLELPFGSEPGYGHARIRGRGSKKQEEGKLDPENMTLSFEVETSNIGTVNVFLVFSGKAVTIRFELEDKTVSDLAKEMHQEICDALVSRGFDVSSVDFTIREETAEDLQQTQNLDIIG